MTPTDVSDCHACGAKPQYQWSRHATAAESEQQKLEIFRLQGRPLTDAEIAERYGLLRVAVTGCEEHHLGNHPDDPDSGLELRALLHEADCAGHGKCRCAPEVGRAAS